MRIKYFIDKIKSALSSGTLLERSKRFIYTMMTRPVEVLFGYISLSKTDNKLNIINGFSDHRHKQSHWISNPDHIRRIVSAYKAAKIIQPNVALPFQIKGLWNEWLSINYKKLITALESENVVELSRLFENLYREQVTIGTGGYDNYIRYRSIFGRYYIKYVWSAYRDKLISLDYDINKLEVPLVGNPTGIIVNGKVISIETLRHAYHSVEICELLRDIPKAIIVEIGGGLGGQAYQVIKMMRENISKYLLFDIPEVAAISSYVLLSALQDKRVRLYGEGPISIDPYEKYDVGIFPNFSISQLENSSVDMFYNSCSFSEMDQLSSMEYLTIIERSCRKYFLHDNHDVKLKFKNMDGSVSINKIGSEFIPNINHFKRIYKKPRVHMLPEDRSFVQYEYLYERLTNNAQNIQ